MSAKPLLIIDQNIPYLKGILEPFADTEYLAADLITHETLKNADGLLIRTRTKINDALLKNTNVHFIASATIGFDHIDVDYCKNQRIAVFNAPGCNAGSVQQYIASVLMTLKKQNQKFGDITLGIVGVGHTGKKVQQFAEAIGMKILLNDPPRKRTEGSKNFVSLEKIYSESDIITFHVPLTFEGEDATFHLLSEQNSALIKKGTTIINASRGEVCDENVLKELVQKKDCTLVIDVWKNEPLIDHELLAFAEISTAHIAGYSADGKANASRIIARKTADFFGFSLDKSSFTEPALSDNNLIIPDKGTFEEIISQCILQTYNVMHDSEILKINPEAFENLRNSYPLRREFSAYNVKSANLSVNSLQTLLKLGFKTI